MTKPYRSHDEALKESLARDPAYAAAYLNAVLEDGDQGEFMLALRQVAEALGGVKSVAVSAELNTTSIYKTLSKAGNPELRSFMGLLDAMGLRIAIEPVEDLAAA